MRKNSEPTTTTLKNIFLTRFLIIFLIPSFLVTSLLFFYFANFEKNFSKNEQYNTLELLSSHLTSIINPNLQISLSYIYDENISLFYNFLDSYDINDNLILYNQLLQPYQKAISRNITFLSNDIYGIGFYPCHHNTDTYLYISKYSDLKEITDKSYTSSKWYTYLSKNDTDVVFTLKSDSDSEYPVISIIRTVKNVDKKRTLGYIVVDVSLSFLYDVCSDLKIGSKNEIILFSPLGEYLFSTADNLHFSSQENISDMNALQIDEFYYDILSLTEPENGFTIFYLTSLVDEYQRYLKILGLILFFYSIMVFMVIILLKSNNKDISKSLTPILNTMTTYNAGKTISYCDTPKIPIKEFRIISNNLNMMIEKINMHINKEYKLQLAQKSAEYQALQAEVNPHFLYNTLNLLISLNRIGAKKELESAIVSLSHLFRYTCDHSSNTTIQKEFQFISDYLYLQQIRYDDLLTFQICFDAELENFTIPKLLIQPLVENAIVHSLEPSGEPIDIKLNAFSVKNQNGINLTIISVVNTGLPFKENADSAKRVGLKNVEERLTIFNPNSFMVINGGIGKPTKCYIIIPMENVEDNEL